MKGYKGFNPGLVCKGKQYQENTVFEEPEAKICQKGMHFCENPFDVLDYYDLIRADGSFNDFAEVEALDNCKTDDRKKFCTKKLKIGVKLSFAGFVKACVDFILERAVLEMPSENVDSGDSAKIGSSGCFAKIGSSGGYAKIGSSGTSPRSAAPGTSPRSIAPEAIPSFAVQGTVPQSRLLLAAGSPSPSGNMTAKRAAAFRCASRPSMWTASGSRPTRHTP